MSRADAIYAAVRAHLDAQRAPSAAEPPRRRRRPDLEQDGMSGAWAAAILGGTGGSPAGLPPLAERQAAANGTFSIPLTETDARLFNVLYGQADYTHSGSHYAELTPGAVSTVPASTVLWTPGAEVSAFTASLTIINDEGEAGIWWGTFTAGEFDGYTLTWSYTDGAVNLNHWVAGTAFKSGVFVSGASFPVILTAQFSAASVSVSTDQDGVLGSNVITQSPARFGFCGLSGNEQVSRFTVTGAA